MSRASTAKIWTGWLYLIVISLLTSIVMYVGQVANQNSTIYLFPSKFIYNNKPTKQLIDNKLRKELLILSYFTFPKPGKTRMRFFCNCIRINTQLNINITYLGDGNTFNFEGIYSKNDKKSLKQSGKILATSEYIQYLTQQYTIEQQKDSIIILFVDGYDVIFQRDYSYILKQFIDMNSKYEYQNKGVIWCTDPYCWPTGHWCTRFTNIAPNDTDTRFLNAGAWIGYLYDVNAMFSHVRATLNVFNNDLNRIKRKFTDDQGFYSHHYWENNSNMILDYYSQIFQRMNFDKQIMFLKENGYYNTEMKHYPSILHFAGGQGKFWIVNKTTNLVNLYASQNAIDLKINGSSDITFATNNGTIRKLKYSEMCSKLTDFFY
eukprot:446393_1